MYFCSIYERREVSSLLKILKKKKSKPTGKSKALQLFISDAVMMMGGSYIFVLALFSPRRKSKERRQIMVNRS